ncbi:MAG TPA: photosynthetic reaction center cytochrome c subunit family protein [Pyrinomonadaceae bacterium]|nr:photosynthetic reaction center cytochrome c subunit family protein [Pyrinomonadaceae bacterium]
MKRGIKLLTISISALAIAAGVLFGGPDSFTDRTANAQCSPPAATPTPATTAAKPFDQAAAIAKLKEQIKGKENEPSTAVFKNIQTPFVKSLPAGRVLAVMEIAYSRSLGVTCTHCHTPDKWESDDIAQKQIARDMAGMMMKLNGELLPAVKNLKSQRPTVNCTTCHRGEIKPATNLPVK